MSRDLTIRLLGRPQVSTDKVTGFRKLVRKYVVEGPRASKAGIHDDLNPLFLPAGATDEEFDTYHLTNQALAPANGTLDKAYLQREFIELKRSALAENYIQKNDLIAVRKRFAVLRNESVSLGYGDKWGSHPSKASTYAKDPWEYAPDWVANATPGSYAYSFSNATSNTGFTDTPAVLYYEDGVSVASDLSKYLLERFSSSGDWLRGTAVMSQVGSELDVWQVEWVTHAAPYWTAGTGKAGERKVSNSMRVVDFDEYGLEVSLVGGTASSNSNVKIKTYNFFTIGSELPESLMEISGGASSTAINNSVDVDLFVTTLEGKSFAIKNHIPGGVWNSSTAPIQFPSTAGGKITVGSTNGYSVIFDYEADMTSESSPIEGFPVFQKTPVRSIAGRISFTSTDRLPITSSSGTFGGTQTTITPIFSHGDTKIWKVGITYVGG